jgi:hypothetical protein
MELARVMATRCPSASIKYVAVASEEQGLHDAQYLAHILSNASANAQGMDTNDIVGSPIDGNCTNSSDIIRLFVQGTP